MAYFSDHRRGIRELTPEHRTRTSAGARCTTARASSWATASSGEPVPEALWRTRALIDRSWNYPGVADAPPEGEWEVLGYHWAKEQLEVEVKRLRAEMEKEGIEVPDCEPDEKAKKRADETLEETEMFSKGKKPGAKGSRRKSKSQGDDE